MSLATSVGKQRATLTAHKQAQLRGGRGCTLALMTGLLVAAALGLGAAFAGLLPCACGWSPGSFSSGLCSSSLHKVVLRCSWGQLAGLVTPL